MAINPGPDGSTGTELMVDINTTPLIDVMLVLLIMLIVTIPIQLHSVNLNMAVRAPAADEVKPEIVKLDIDARGVVYWNGQAMPDRLSIEARMRAAAAQPLQPQVQLRPDKAARYETVAAVMASAQRTGLSRMGIVGSEQFAHGD